MWYLLAALAAPFGIYLGIKLADKYPGLMGVLIIIVLLLILMSHPIPSGATGWDMLREILKGF